MILLATFRLGGNIKIDDAALNKTVERAIARTVTKQQRAGNLANQSIRRQATLSWFRGFNAETMLSHLAYRTVVKQRNSSIILEFESYIDAYNANHTSLYSWNIRHGNPVDPSNFIIDLQWNEGIIGLPAISSMTDWVNTHFHQYQSLQKHTQLCYRHLWGSTVSRYL